MMKISVSSYSFQRYIADGKMTQLDCLEKAKEIGIDTVDFIDLKPCENPTLEQQKEYAAQIRAKADELGMNIEAYYIGANLYHETEEECEKEVKRVCDQLDVAKILGCKVMRHDVTYRLVKDGKGKSFDLQLPTIAENCRKIADYGKTLGIKTCVENHGIIAQDSDRMERLFNAVNHDNFGILIDFGNFVCVDENPVTAVSRLAPYATIVHAKDMHLYSGSEPNPGFVGITRGCNYLRGAIIGQGNVPVKQCIKVVKREGYDGYLCIEFEGKEDCIMGITQGYQTLKRYLEEVEAEFNK